MKFHADRLDSVVFISGAVIMILELVGSRILAPYLGLSLYVWTSIIGIILLALSVGYAVGGKLADKNPSYRTLQKILTSAGFTFLVLALLKDVVPALSSYIGPLGGSLIASTILFLPVSVLLAMIAPYAIKLRLTNLENTGRTAGNLYAFSTVGSICGTFLAGYLLIPNFYTSTILYALAVVIFVASAIIYKPPVISVIFIIFALALTWYALRIFYASSRVVASEPSAYALITVENVEFEGRKIRILVKDAETHAGMYLDRDKEKPVFPYLRFFSLDEYFYPNPKNAILIGAGSYASAKDFLNRFSRATMDVVEIDPTVTEIAKRYFNFPNTDRISVIHKDGRQYLNQNKKKYDIVYNDSFSSYYSVPYQLTTREALTKINNSLTENGVFITNLISALDGYGGDFFKAEYKTFKSVFPRVYAFAVSDTKDKKYAQNIILVGIKNKNFVAPDKEKFNTNIQNYLSHELYPDIPINTPVLTDDFAPVDNYIARLSFARN